MRLIAESLEVIHAMPYVCSGHKGEPVAQTLDFVVIRAEGLPDEVDALVATADLQGRDRPGGRLLGEWVAEELHAMSELGVIPVPSAVLLAGDFYDDPLCSKRGRTGDVQPVWQAFASRFPKVTGVHGNHDLLKQVPGDARVLDGTVENVAGIRLGGLCGIMGRSTRLNRRDPADYLARYRSVLDQAPDIMMSHCGPDHPASGRIGEASIRELLEKSGDSLVIFGHCHWRDPIAEIGRNQVLNVDARMVVIVR